jgi:formylglycine-generating enzyme required for sulfatase activity
MGCVSGNDCKNDEKPIKQRRIKAFLLGRYEVTFAQYDQFVIATQSHNPERSYPDDEAWGRATRPVINVSWYDAKAYVDWLAVQTGKQYRLPSEAEWEYAARASKRTRWSFGDDENVLREYAWFDENSGSKTHPIGGLEPNLWGLYDMHGNVKEWVQDCWHESYQEAPDDGSAWETGDCKHRVLRSGSWFRRSWFLRSAYREKFMGDLDDFDVGFRVAQGEPDT